VTFLGKTCLVSGIILLWEAMILVVLDRLHTFHQTEMEAFVNGWRYWLAVAVLIAAGIVLLKFARMKP